jgi:hypothetical protein
MPPLQRDPHAVLKSEIVTKINIGIGQGGQVEATLVRSQWSKTEIGLTLHVNPDILFHVGPTTDRSARLSWFYAKRSV